VLMDAAGVEEKFGVPPEKIVDMLALMGDASDNVPGVRGVGPKTAVKLLKEFDDLDGVYGHLDQVAPEGLRERLRAGREEAFLSRKLVTLALDAPFDLDLVSLKRTFPDRDEVLRLLAALEFGRMAGLLLDSGTAGEASGRDSEGAHEEGPSKGDRENAARYVGSGAADETVTRERGGDVLSAHKRAESRADADEGGSRTPEAANAPLRDYLREASKLDAGVAARGRPAAAAADSGEPWSFAIGAVSGDQAAFAVCAPSRSPLYQQVITAEERSAVKDFLQDVRRPKATYDLKAEAHAAASAGWTIRGVTDDVLLASYLLDPEGNHSLEALEGRWLGGTPAPELEMALEAALNRKAKAIGELDGVLSAQIMKAGMDTLLREVEVPLALVLQEMEATGVALDVSCLAELGGRLAGMIKRSEEDIYCMAGVTFNINSPQQLSEVLFSHLGLRPKRKTKTGYSTDSAVLEELAADNELPREILNYRQLVKLKSTYVDALPKLVDSTGRVHATFHQAVTATGRLSSSNPNLQNIPIRTELGREIRKAFVPGRQGWVLVAADYSQIELRIMAHLSGDEALMQSFERDEDVHAATASAIFGVPLDKVDEQLRSRAKMVNYGVMYGMGPGGLARRLGMGREEAARFIEEYFAKMPGVRSFLEALIEQARQRGYARTIMNRRRALPGILSSDRRAKAFAERAAVNTPIQGSAADIIKKAMVLIDGRIAAEGMAAKLILQVHDELVFECPSEETAPLSRLVKDVMESAVEIKVPLSVRVETGSNWCETHR
jgi:DNA polymerase-1